MQILSGNLILVWKFNFNFKLLRADAFVDMFRELMRNAHYSVDTLKTVNSHCINYSGNFIEK